jgi:hypothetical protein
MRAEDTLQFMMDFNGNLFWSRQQCLDHLFCTIGNGYEWENGELVEKDYDTKQMLSRWQLIEPVKHAEPRQLAVELNEIREEIQRRRGFKEIPKWYPLSKEYSYLYNYPDNIKSDWLALIKECKQMLIADGIEI